MTFHNAEYTLWTCETVGSLGMTEINSLSKDFERVAIHAAREHWCCAWPCTTCGAGEIRSAYAKIGLLPDDLRFLKIEGPTYFRDHFEFTDDHFEGMREADFELIMREARIEDWKSPIRAFALLALNNDREKLVRNTLEEKLKRLKEVEQKFFLELSANPNIQFK